MVSILEQYSPPGLASGPNITSLIQDVIQTMDHFISSDSRNEKMVHFDPVLRASLFHSLRFYPPLGSI